MAKKPINTQNKSLLIILSGLGLVALLIILFLGRQIYLNLNASLPTDVPALPSFSSPEPTETLSTELPTDIPSTPENKVVPDPNSFPLADAYEWGVFLTGLERPIDLTHANDDSERIFIAEQAGVIRIWQGGEILDTPFLDIRNIVNSSGNERGLLGLSFHPEYSTTGYFYVNYTDIIGNTTISRFQVSDNPFIANLESELVLLSVYQPYANHNGGGLAFDLDGYLFAGLGDGGFRADPLNSGQNQNSLLGKLIRFDVNNDLEPEIWAIGLRNPWRLSFDSFTGDLYLGDVGQSLYEEVNYLPFGTAAGTNFGWKLFEGNHSFSGIPSESTEFVFPVAEYSHEEGDCSISGGKVYRGTDHPEWNGIYFYGDYCSGKIWGLFQATNGEWQNQLLFEIDAFISSFGVDEHGEIYVLDLMGTIFKLEKK